MDYGFTTNLRPSLATPARLFALRWVFVWALCCAFFAPQVNAQLLVPWSGVFDWPVLFLRSGLSSDDACASFFSGRVPPFSRFASDTFAFTGSGLCAPIKDYHFLGNSSWDAGISLGGGHMWWPGSISASVLTNWASACFTDDVDYVGYFGSGHVESTGFHDYYVCIETQRYQSLTFYVDLAGYLWSDGVPVYSEFGSLAGSQEYYCISLPGTVAAVVSRNPIYFEGDITFTSLLPWRGTVESDGTILARLGNNLLASVALGAANVVSLSSDFGFYLRNSFRNWLYSDLMSAPSAASSYSVYYDYYDTGYLQPGFVDDATDRYLSQMEVVSGADGLSNSFSFSLTNSFLGASCDYESSTNSGVQFYSDSSSSRSKTFYSFQDVPVLVRGGSYLAKTNAFQFSSVIDGDFVVRNFAHVRAKSVYCFASMGDLWPTDGPGFESAFIGYYPHGQLSVFRLVDFSSYSRVITRLLTTIRNRNVFRFLPNDNQIPSFSSGSSRLPSFNDHSNIGVPSFLR